MLRSRWEAARGEQGSGSRPQREQLAARCWRSRDDETAVGGQGRPSRSARRSSSRALDARHPEVDPAATPRSHGEEPLDVGRAQLRRGADRSADRRPPGDHAQSGPP
eukprot:scaffold50356_cov15-Phaeocystis_antarctica.AAC.1